jgi:hypothetical protein
VEQALIPRGQTFQGRQVDDVDLASPELHTPTPCKCPKALETATRWTLIMLPSRSCVKWVGTR